MEEKVTVLLWDILISSIIDLIWGEKNYTSDERDKLK